MKTHLSFAFFVLLAVFLLMVSIVTSLHSAQPMYFKPVASKVIPMSNIQFGDITGDGIADLFYAVTNYSGGRCYPTKYTYLGKSDGSFEFGFSYTEISSPDPRCVMGDWKKGGALELLGIYPYFFNVLLEFSNMGFSHTPLFTNDSPYYYYNFNYQDSAVGDFNGDSYADATVRTTFYNTSLTLFLGNGDGSFALKDYPSLFTGIPGRCDLNKDGYDDLFEASGNKLIAYYGDSNIDTIFSVSNEFPLPVLCNQVFPMEYKENRHPDFLITGATEMYLLKNQGQNKFQSIPVNLPNAATHEVLFCDDIDQDEIYDIGLFANSTLILYRGEPDGSFTQIVDIPLKFTDRIIFCHSADMNKDSLKDIVLCTSDGYVITLLESINPVSTPTPTPTSTPLFKPVMPPTPTPTPVSFIPAAIHAKPGDSFYQIVSNAPDNSTILFSKGTYHFTRDDYPKITSVHNKKIHFIGEGSNLDVIFYGTFIFYDSDITIQNISINPEPRYKTPVIANNSNLTLIHNQIFSCMDEGEQYYQLSNAESTIQFQYAANKKLTLIDNQIEHKKAAIVSILSCTDSSISIENNSMFGIQEQYADIHIIISKGIDLHLPILSTNDSDLSNLNVSGSEVDVYSGIIHGKRGQDRVKGEDGSPGVAITNNSTVTFHNTLTFGGNGGDGIISGHTAESVYCDASSHYGWATSVNSWELY